MVMLYLHSGSTQHLYQDMRNYFVIVLMNIYRNNPIDKLLSNSICIMIRGNMCILYTRKDIIPNQPLHFQRSLLVLLSVSSNMDFGDTWEVSLTGTYFMYLKNMNVCVLTIYMNVPFTSK